MRNLVIALAFAICAALPQAASARDPAPGQTPKTADRSLPSSKVPELLQKVGVNLISKAKAAECTAEGETCASNEQCCPGLQCAGGPPATCATED